MTGARSAPAGSRGRGRARGLPGPAVGHPRRRDPGAREAPEDAVPEVLGAAAAFGAPGRCARVPSSAPRPNTAPWTPGSTHPWGSGSRPWSSRDTAGRTARPSASRSHEPALRPVVPMAGCASGGARICATTSPPASRFRSIRPSSRRSGTVRRAAVFMPRPFMENATWDVGVTGSMPTITASPGVAGTRRERARASNPDARVPAVGSKRPPGRHLHHAAIPTRLQSARAVVGAPVARRSPSARHGRSGVPPRVRRSPGR